MPTTEEIIIQLKDEFSGKMNEILGQLKKTEEHQNSLVEKGKKIGEAVGAFFAVEKLLEYGKEVFNVTAAFENMRAEINTLERDKISSTEIFGDLNEIGKGIVSTQELTDSYVQLRNIGLKPTKESMEKLADFAVAQNKSVKGYSDAFSKAMMGQFKGLSEFGIKVGQSSKHADKLTVSFRGQNKEISNNQKALREYLMSLSELGGIRGAVEAQRETTVGGAAKGFKDAVETLELNVGKKFSGVFTSFLNDLTKVVERVGKWVETPISEEVQNRNEQLKPLVDKFTDNLYNGNKTIADAVRAQIESIAPKFFEGVNLEKQSEIQNRLAEYLRQYNEQLSKEDRSSKIDKYEDLVKSAIEASLKTQESIKTMLHEQGKYGYGLEGLQLEENFKNWGFDVGLSNVTEYDQTKRDQYGRDRYGNKTVNDQLRDIEGKIIPGSQKLLEEYRINTKLLEQYTEELKLLREQDEGKVEGGETPSDKLSAIESAAPKVFNINITNLVNEMTIAVPQLAESKTQIKKIVVEALEDSVNNAQVIAFK